MVKEEQDSPLSVVAMAIGMIAGALIGFVLWIATDTFALFPAFLGVGLVLGMVLQSTMERRSGDPTSPVAAQTASEVAVFDETFDPAGHSFGEWRCES